MKAQKKIRREILDEMTRDMILEAALEVLNQDGLNNLTMLRVSQQAGVAKGTLYLYFKDKQALLQGATKKGFDAYLVEVEGLLSGDMDAAQKIEAYIRHNVSIVDRNRKIIEDMDINSPAFEQIGWHKKDSPYWTMVDKLSSVFDEGIQQGLFKPLNSEFAACVLIDTLATFRHWHQMGKTAGTEQSDSRLLSDLIFSGICQ